MQENLTTPTGLVYLIQEEGTSLFKIGFSRTPQKRLAGLQTGNPHKLKIVKTWPAARHVETELHARFSSLRGSGEWFTIECLEDLMPVLDLLTSSFNSFTPKPRYETERQRSVSPYVESRIAVLDQWRETVATYCPESKDEAAMKKALLLECASYRRVLLTSNRAEPSRSHLLNILTIKRLMARLGIVTAEPIA